METREAILSEATRQLTEVGYAAFTMASVRKALELSSGSMFHAFPSKAALAAAVYVEGMAAYQSAAMAAIEKARGPQRALRAWIAVHLEWIEEHRTLAGYLFSTLPEEVMAEVERPLAQRNAAFYLALDALFDRAVDAGLMGRLPREVALALCVGPAHDYCRKWTRGAVDVSPRKLKRVFQDAMCASLASTQKGAPK